MKIEEIEKALKRTFQENCSLSLNCDQADIKELVTDSRNHFSSENALFFAINTPGGNDGHKFMSNLYRKGVRNFICEYIPEGFPQDDTLNIFIVPSSIEALTAIGSLNRDNAGEIVAITGSRGKTTVKEMIFQLMEPMARISRSPRSYNSKIGVPLSLWQISPETDFALIEAGISQTGEMQRLSQTIKPDTVIFTNIGEAHSNGFESMLIKAQEKALLAENNNVKNIIYPLDDSYLPAALHDKLSGRNVIAWSFKNRNADLYMTYIPDNLQYAWQGVTHNLKVKIEKDFDLHNIASTLAFLLLKGLTHENIQKRFDSLQKIKTRLNVTEGINRCSIIRDSYTSDLSSLIPAIDFANRRKMPGQTLTLILSDLHHETQSLEETYKQIAKISLETSVEKLIGIGKDFKKYAGLFPKSYLFYSDIDEYLKKFSAADFSNELILIKGSGNNGFERIFQQLEARNHETVLEVNLDAMLQNYNYFRSFLPSSCGLIAMVKASGYGAGSYEIAKTLQDAGASYLAVAVVDEGIDLRDNGIIMPIMIMNPRAANYKALFKYKLQPVVYSLDMLKIFIDEVQKYCQDEYPVHIKLDTGMHRMGFVAEELESLVKVLKKGTNIKVGSIFSHLATADCLDMDEFTLRQLNRFEEMSSFIINELGYDIKRHILNSAGILRFPQYHYDYARLGIGLYGANTLPPEIEKSLSPVSSLRTVIICLRDVKEGEAVGYSRKGEIKGQRKIATLPIGYADGMNRKFGNGAIKVFLNGQYAPTIGNICMDATMIDVTGIDCKEGDSVEIFGENASLQRLADAIDTIPYEVLTSVSPRVKRIYFRE